MTVFKDILHMFRDGNICDICRTNIFVKFIGYRHFNLRRHEEGKHNEARKVVMAEMRELAKLHEVFQNVSECDQVINNLKGEIC